MIITQVCKKNVEFVLEKIGVISKVVFSVESKSGLRTHNFANFYHFSNLKKPPKIGIIQLSISLIICMIWTFITRDSANWKKKNLTSYKFVPSYVAHCETCNFFQLAISLVIKVQIIHVISEMKSWIVSLFGVFFRFEK